MTFATVRRRFNRVLARREQLKQLMLCHSAHHRIQRFGFRRFRCPAEKRRYHSTKQHGRRILSSGTPAFDRPAREKVVDIAPSGWPPASSVRSGSGGTPAFNTALDTRRRHGQRRKKRNLYSRICGYNFPSPLLQAKAGLKNDASRHFWPRDIIAARSLLAHGRMSSVVVLLHGMLATRRGCQLPVDGLALR